MRIKGLIKSKDVKVIGSGKQKQKVSTVGDNSEGGERELVLVAISG